MVKVLSILGSVDRRVQDEGLLIGGEEHSVDFDAWRGGWRNPDVAALEALAEDDAHLFWLVEEWRHEYTATICPFLTYSYWVSWNITQMYQLFNCIFKLLNLFLYFLLR